MECTFTSIFGTVSYNTTEDNNPFSKKNQKKEIIKQTFNIGYLGAAVVTSGVVTVVCSNMLMQKQKILPIQGKMLTVANFIMGFVITTGIGVTLYKRYQEVNKKIQEYSAAVTSQMEKSKLIIINAIKEVINTKFEEEFQQENSPFILPTRERFPIIIPVNFGCDHICDLSEAITEKSCPYENCNKEINISDCIILQEKTESVIKVIKRVFALFESLLQQIPKASGSNRRNFVEFNYLKRIHNTELVVNSNEDFVERILNFQGNDTLSATEVYAIAFFISQICWPIISVFEGRHKNKIENKLTADKRQRLITTTDFNRVREALQSWQRNIIRELTNEHKIINSYRPQRNNQIRNLLLERLLSAYYESD